MCSKKQSTLPTVPGAWLIILELAAFTAGSFSAGPERSFAEQSTRMRQARPGLPRGRLQLGSAQCKWYDLFSQSVNVPRPDVYIVKQMHATLGMQILCLCRNGRCASAAGTVVMLNVGGNASTPAECCRACKSNTQCNIWSLCYPDPRDPSGPQVRSRPPTAES